MVYEGSHDLSAGKRFFLWLGASDSNEEPVGYELPSPLVDEVISWDDEEEDLRGLLKKCSSWGGFPVYRFYPDGKHPAGVLYGQPDLPSFLPFLLDGLLEI
jgi:hypothetical protein